MRHGLLRNLLVGFVVLGGLAAGGPRAAEPPSWPRFHGPTGDNISPDTGLLAKWPTDGPETPLDRQGPRRGLLLGRPGRRPHLHQRQQGRQDRRHRPGPRRQDPLATAQRRGLERRPSRRPLHSHHRRRLPLRRKPAGRGGLPGGQRRQAPLARQYPGEVRRREHQVGPGRVALDRRPARDLLPRRAADRRGRPGQEDRRGGLEIAPDRRRDRLRLARGDPVRRPADRPDHDRQGA